MRCGSVRRGYRLVCCRGRLRPPTSGALSMGGLMEADEYQRLLAASRAPVREPVGYRVAAPSASPGARLSWSDPRDPRRRPGGHPGRCAGPRRQQGRSRSARPGRAGRPALPAGRRRLLRRPPSGRRCRRDRPPGGVARRRMPAICSSSLVALVAPALHRPRPAPRGFRRGGVPRSRPVRDLPTIAADRDVRTDDPLSPHHHEHGEVDRSDSRGMADRGVGDEWRCVVSDGVGPSGRSGRVSGRLRARDAPQRDLRGGAAPESAGGLPGA